MTPIPPTKDSEILGRALESLADRDLWCQGHYRAKLADGRVAHCAEGAVYGALAELHCAGTATARGGVIAFQTETTCRIMDRVLNALREIFPDCAAGRFAFVDHFTFVRERVAHYNDHPGMDHPTILAAFEKARNKALEEGN
jgi:hypothetical protein